MVLEMNIGIICGCLSSVKPVMAAGFPTLFGTCCQSRTRTSPRSMRTYTGGSTYPGSLASYPLSDVSNNHRHGQIERALYVDEIIRSESTGQSSHAWASDSSGDDTSALRFPVNAITVHQAITVVEENTSTPSLHCEKAGEANGASDAGSEGGT